MIKSPILRDLKGLSFFDDTVPNLMHDMTGVHCKVEFDIPMRENLMEEMRQLFTVYEKICCNGAELLYLLTESESTMKMLNMLKYQLSIVSAPSCHRSAIDTFGTEEQIEAKIKIYQERLNIEYIEPKRKLEKEQARLHSEIDAVVYANGWHKDFAFSADPNAKPTMKIMG